MKILVYGAGNIGSLYAGLLSKSGQDVTILARGRRLAAIRKHGIELKNVITGETVAVDLDAIEHLNPEDAYDLVMVVMGMEHIPEVLPVLARNTATPAVMFVCNNASGPDQMVEALGEERVLLGFPGAAGITEAGVLRYLITSEREQPTTIGELDGTRSPRIQAIAEALAQAGFPVAICPNMDAWLKTHVSEIVPTANALYSAATDASRLARTRDALVLMLRAIREGHEVLRARGIPILPGFHEIFRWLPEPLLVSIMRRRVSSEGARTKIGHAAAARGEMKTIAGEFKALARQTSIDTPSMDRLYRYLDPAVEPLADGSASIPLHWGGVWILIAGVVAMVIVVAALLRFIA